jgi:Zn-dependent peptidase ImmA (M78 family)/transcriptional regulator with XRE-family HTH domain
MMEVTAAEVERARPIARAFSPDRMTLARQVAGKSKREVADLAGKSPTAMTQFELGQAKPSAETLARCASALSVPIEFFAGGRPFLKVDTGSAHFRSLRATRSYQREQAMGFVALLWEVVQAVERVVELPPLSLPGLHDFTTFSTPGDAAKALRMHLGNLHEPLPHLVRHAEAQGVVVSVLPHTLSGDVAGGSPDHPTGVGNVDAFSIAIAHRPLIGLTGAKGGLLRRRFNVAHELGHILLHPEARPGDQQHEREAHLFAAELLMPAEPILEELPERPEPGKLLPLQQKWGSSVSALGYRGKTLGKYSESQLRRLMISLSQLGWRTNEPEDRRLLEGEEPVLLSKAVDLGASAGLSPVSIAEQLALPLPLVRTFLGIPDERPRLKLL